jgi:hypothetical protein
MRKTMRLAASISLAATLALSLSAMAEEHNNHLQGHPAGHPGGPSGGHPGPGGHPPGPPGGHPGPGFHPGGGPGGQHAVHQLGERGYSFRGPGGVRREIVAFSPREREIWLGGHWHHEMRFGRMGYWYEVNGAWYFYDQPFVGPPTYVSEVEFMDPELVVAPVVVAPAPVVVAPAPVVVVRPPPVVCVGPLCVR